MLSACCAYEQQHFVRRKYYPLRCRDPIAAPRLPRMSELTRRLPRPDAVTLAGLVTVAFFVVLVTARGLVDADYFWHVTTGHLIVTDGFPRTDPFSFTWFGRPWVLHE